MLSIIIFLMEIEENLSLKEQLVSVNGTLDQGMKEKHWMKR